MKAHGKMLVNEAPDQTTELLKTLCTDYRPVNMPLVDDNTLDGSAPRSVLQAKPDEFIHIFVNNSAKLREFLEHMIKVQPGSSSLVYNTLIELYLHDVVHEASASQRKVKEEKILGMLQNPAAGYDIDQALVLCQMHNFRLGVLYLYEKSKLYQQILSHHMEHKEYTNIVDTCKKFGTEEPNLWVQALWYFAKTEDCYKTYLTEVLTQIDKKNLLPPLMVVETLGQNSTATLAVIKDYIMKRLKLENDEIAENERLIKQFKEETVKMRGQIEELKTSAQIFQVSKCSACNHPLELPSVHFLCQHSYHQHCFESYADNEQECPACLPQNKRVLDRIKEQEQSRNLHDQFHSQLQNAQDGFAVVADYFRRGVFNNATLVPDPQHQTKPPSGLSRARDTLDRK
ncbi:PREDICTED: vacuolar protein sorting-associated protein 11 homolog [Priapulus caudatus]|uniref:Vacuolar protein sorting-associated protein 11 homolog n=1 Tax=Priapulus caudatus TaxID=37621 RepID=A0ABM1F2N4_PRICU|nr:PREDICTED: vacuolar protein sorting-associated protein 11 homolog [Priapulus caudatus]